MIRRPLKFPAEMVATAWDIASLRYPPFVYGHDQGGFPVFCFHGVEPDSLRRQLEFLVRNGYRCLTTDDLDPLLSGGSLPAKSVMLTFDDGWGSLWSVGFPILREFGLRVVVFLVPARVQESGVGPTLDDLKTGRCTPDCVLGRDSSEIPLLTWQEIRQMHDSGLVDFQSHTLTHNLVFCSPRIVDYVRPDLMKTYSLFEVPEWRPGAHVLSELGRPIYESSPRMGDRRRYIENTDLGTACVEYVARHGGVDLFSRPDWRIRLDKLARSFSPSSVYETNEARTNALRHELSESKRLVEEHLPGKRVRYVCYPWHCFSSLAVQLSLEAGYVANFVAKANGRFCGVRLGRPVMIGRVGGDFLFRLPGEGRVSLLSILFRKLNRRAGGG